MIYRDHPLIYKTPMLFEYEDGDGGLYIEWGQINMAEVSAILPGSKQEREKHPHSYQVWLKNGEKHTVVGQEWSEMHLFQIGHRDWLLR